MINIDDLARTDLFKVKEDKDAFVGNPFKIDYNKTSILTCDYWKYKSGGIAQGCFLLAFYENKFQSDVEEAILLRALKPCSIPSDNKVIQARIEYFKEEREFNIEKEVDKLTQFEFSFSGLECSILGTFYKNAENRIEFGADLENFYSPHLYKVYKPTGDFLEFIVNLRKDDSPLSPESNTKIGYVRYSSSRRNFPNEYKQGDKSDFDRNRVNVHLHTKEVLGKRTALFGMTRTGKSNTIKKLIEATTELSKKATLDIAEGLKDFKKSANPFTENDIPKYPVGQIIFDINGEYANKNLQDGTAIFEKYSRDTVRYSILDNKLDDGFKIMKVNFFYDIQTGVDYLKQFLEDDETGYIRDFKSIDFSKPKGKDFGGWNKYNKYKSIYLCCLREAGYKVPRTVRGIKIKSNEKLDALIHKFDNSFDSSKELTVDEAFFFWETVWKNRNDDCFKELKKDNKGKDWLSPEIRALLVLLFKERENGQSIDGCKKFNIAIDLHTSSANASFQKDIEKFLRQGKIVIIDLSQGDNKLQKIFSEKICLEIFKSSMKNFTNAQPNNFIQFYFEEAHNLFPKKEDKDLSQIYNRIAKEGAKLNLGMTYATQEVSSISSNILKNTQNWFIAHLNNEDEIKELKKFYDFSDFTDAIIKFSAKNDKGFVRMKTYSNPFIVPVQIDLFE